MIRKKTIQLLLYDYQRTARYYTIYRTFKSWSSDDFTTIPRLLATTISAGTLPLLLTSISYRAKARKELRRKPSMVPRRPPCPCRWTSPPGGGCQIASRRAGMVCGMLHLCTLIYLIIIGRLCCLVQRPAWRWYLGMRWRRYGVVMCSSVSQVVL